MINRSIHNFFALAAVLCNCLFLTACENDERTIQAWTQRKQMVEEAINVETFFSQSGTMKARLRSPLMLRYQGDSTYVEFPKTLHVDFFDSTGKRESWLDCRYAKYFETANKVLLQDSVKVISIKGDTLTTPELWWDQNTRLFYTDKDVRIATLTRNIYGGKGLEAAQDLSWHTIKEIRGSLLVGSDVIPE